MNDPSYEGCDQDIIDAVRALPDPEILREAIARSGISGEDFAHNVILCHYSAVWRWMQGEFPIRSMTKRFLVRELIRARHRIRHGTLPEGSWCPACGRGGDDRPVLHFTRTPYDTDEPRQVPEVRSHDGG